MIQPDDGGYDTDGYIGLPEEDYMANPMHVFWQDWEQEGVPFRSYLIGVTTAGLSSRHVPTAKEDDALRRSGVAGGLTGLPLETLRQFGCSPDPNDP